MKTKSKRRQQVKQRLKRWVRDGRPRKLEGGFSFELLKQFPNWRPEMGK